MFIYNRYIALVCTSHVTYQVQFCNNPLVSSLKKGQVIINRVVLSIIITISTETEIVDWMGVCQVVWRAEEKPNAFLSLLAP